jgi:hypothetical protein
MNSTLSPTQSWFSDPPTTASEEATLVPVEMKNKQFPIKLRSLDKQILIAIAFPITFCIGIAVGAVWQSSRNPIVPQVAPAPVAASSNLEPKLEAMSLGLAAVRQNLAELASGLGQVRNDITDVQTVQQSLFDKMSEPPPRPAAAPTAKPTPRPPQAPPVR